MDGGAVWACRSPDWLWGSAVDRALVEREWRREAARDSRGGRHPDRGVSDRHCRLTATFQVGGAVFTPLC